MIAENLTRSVSMKMSPDDHDNLKKIARENGHSVGSFLRFIVSNEIQRLETYNKEKNQTWDIE